MIASLSYSTPVQQIDWKNFSRGISDSKDLPPPPSFGGEDFKASPMGQLMSLRSNLSAEDKSTMDSFMKQLFQQIDSGSFDAAKAADNAPQAMKDFAAKNGIDLKQLFSDLKQHHDEMKARLQSQGYDAQGTPSQPGIDIQKFLDLLSNSSASKS